MIDDVTYGEASDLPGVQSLSFADGGFSFPYRGFRFSHGKLCVVGALALPVVDNKTSLMAFTDMHPLKSRHYLEMPLESTGRIANALILPAIDNYYHFLIYRLTVLAFLTEAARTGITTVATINTIPARVTAAVDALINERSEGQVMTRLSLADGVYDMDNVVIGQSRNPWFGSFFNRTYTLPILLRRAGLQDSIASAAPLKLFIRRQAEKRRLVNQAEIENLLVGRGYTSIDPGVLEFHEQAVLFARATHIIGVEGAAMTNLVFAVRAVAVAIIANPNAATDPFFTDLVERYDTKAIMIVGEFVNGPDALRNSDFTAPLATIDALTRT